MKAMILVGGYGTRLRPLSLSEPKPLVPFANQPMVSHQIEALVKVGVKTVVLAVSYKPAKMVAFVEDAKKKYKIDIIISVEDEPLGTAGPVALAKKHLTVDDEPFFMFNSDVICEFPLQSMLDFHKAHGGEGTILVTRVKDPSKYGVVVFDEAKGQIEDFVEKPVEFVGDKINAGMYLFNPSMIDRIPVKPTSIEREIFPAMASDKQLYAMVLPGYWMDIGQPKDFLRGNRFHLKYMHESKQLNTPDIAGVTINAPVLIDPSAKIEAGAVIGPDVVIGANVVVKAGARVVDSVVFADVSVGSHAFVRHSIIGWETRLGNWSRVTDCVFGKDVTVKDEVCAHGITCCPNKGIKADEHVSRIIL
jgi:mannose-1-phosphate guanylyltransferase